MSYRQEFEAVASTAMFVKKLVAQCFIDSLLRQTKFKKALMHVAWFLTRQQFLKKYLRAGHNCSLIDHGQLPKGKNTDWISPQNQRESTQLREGNPSLFSAFKDFTTLEMSMLQRKEM